MRILGISIKKNELWYAVVEGSQMDDATIIDIGKQNFRNESATLMLDFHNLFNELISKYKPDRVAHKLSLDIKLNQIPYLHFPFGVLHLICSQKGVGINSRSTSWISAGSNKKTNRFYNHFTQKKFNQDELHSALVAWYELGE